jgi:hypothetical protein
MLKLFLLLQFAVKNNEKTSLVVTTYSHFVNLLINFSSFVEMNN